jgi:hypothetical protein
MVIGHVNTDFSKFPASKQIQVAKLILKFHEQPVEGFDLDGLQPALIANRIFLTNKRQQLVCFNGDKVDMWVFCPLCRKEGFASEMDMKGFCGECRKERE